MFGAEYATSTSSNSNAGRSDKWGLNAAGAFGLGLDNIGAEIDAGLHSHSWSLGGALFWAPAAGLRLGPTLSYRKLNFSGLQGDVTTYGGFGKVFVTQSVKLSVKGGAATGSSKLAGVTSRSSTGSYVGGGITGYLIPDFALNGGIDYVQFNSIHVTTYGAGAEYQVSETFPMSVHVGYSHSQVSGGLNHSANTLHIGVKFYTGRQSLAVHQRDETEGDIGTVTGLEFAF
jgi:hypothetical protein